MLKKEVKKTKKSSDFFVIFNVFGYL
jgi:hypothetical protein